MNLTQLSNHYKQLKSFVGLDSESLEIQNNDEVQNDLGDFHVGLVGSKSPITYFLKKNTEYNSESNLSILQNHGKRKFTIPAMGSLRKNVEVNTGEIHVGVVGCKSPTIFCYSKINNLKLNRITPLQNSSKLYNRFTKSQKKNVEDNLGDTKITQIGSQNPILSFYLKIKKLEAKVCRPLQDTKLIPNWSCVYFE